MLYPVNLLSGTNDFHPDTQVRLGISFQVGSLIILKKSDPTLLTGLCLEIGGFEDRGYKQHPNFAFDEAKVSRGSAPKLIPIRYDIGSSDWLRVRRSIPIGCPF